MNKDTYEALKNVVKGARFYLNRKYGDRKRLDKNEVWEQATITRDIVAVESWIDEVAKEYENDTCQSCKSVGKKLIYDYVNQEWICLTCDQKRGGKETNNIVEYEFMNPE